MKVHDDVGGSITSLQTLSDVVVWLRHVVAAACDKSGCDAGHQTADGRPPPSPGEGGEGKGKDDDSRCADGGPRKRLRDGGRALFDTTNTTTPMVAARPTKPCAPFARRGDSLVARGRQCGRLLLVTAVTPWCHSALCPMDAVNRGGGGDATLGRVAEPAASSPVNARIRPLGPCRCDAAKTAQGVVDYALDVVDYVVCVVEGRRGGDVVDGAGESASECTSILRDAPPRPVPPPTTIQDTSNSEVASPSRNEQRAKHVCALVAVTVSKHLWEGTTSAVCAAPISSAAGHAATAPANQFYADLRSLAVRQLLRTALPTTRLSVIDPLVEPDQHQQGQLTVNSTTSSDVGSGEHQRGAAWRALSTVAIMARCFPLAPLALRAPQPSSSKQPPREAAMAQWLVEAHDQRRRLSVADAMWLEGELRRFHRDGGGGCPSTDSGHDGSIHVPRSADGPLVSSPFLSAAVIRSANLLASDRLIQRWQRSPSTPSSLRLDTDETGDAASWSAILQAATPTAAAGRDNLAEAYSRLLVKITRCHNT